MTSNLTRDRCSFAEATAAEAMAGFDGRTVRVDSGTPTAHSAELWSGSNDGQNELLLPGTERVGESDPDALAEGFVDRRPDVVGVAKPPGVPREQGVKHS